MLRLSTRNSAPPPCPVAASLTLNLFGMPHRNVAQGVGIEVHMHVACICKTISFLSRATRESQRFSDSVGGMAANSYGALYVLTSFVTSRDV